MDMEALIVTNRLALCTAHPNLDKRGGIELIEHLFIHKKKLKNLKSRFRQLAACCRESGSATGHLAGARNTFIFYRLQVSRTGNAGHNAACCN